MEQRCPLPSFPPMPFAAKHWPSLIVQDGQPKRRVYETAVVSTLKDRLRAGDVWVDGSREYQRFDSYLMPRDRAEVVMCDAGFETDPEAWLADRRGMSGNRLTQVDRVLKRNAIPGVRIERGRLKITPHDAVTPPSCDTSRAGDRCGDAAYSYHGIALGGARTNWLP